MTAAKTASVAKTITFALSDAPTYSSGPDEFQVHSIEFTEGSRFIVLRGPAPITKADNGLEAIVGSYTESNGKYILAGFGEVTISGSSVTVAPTGAAPQTVNATVTPTAASGTQQVNAARTWKPDNCIVKISGDGVKIDKSFSPGCNLQTIATYAADNGVKGIDMTQVNGYNLSEVIFTGSKTMVLRFSNGKNFYGTYTLSGTSLTYTLSEGNDLINASASGTLEYPANGKATLILNAKVKNYSGSIELNLSETN